MCSLKGATSGLYRSVDVLLGEADAVGLLYKTWSLVSFVPPV